MPGTKAARMSSRSTRTACSRGKPSWRRRFADFILETEVEPDPANGHSAAGVIFRHVNDENFYSFLLSSRGNFRVDVLFNNHPMTLVDWTRVPEPDPERAPAVRANRLLRVIAHGSRPSFHVDDEWVAEVEDEMLPEGNVGFAAQNFAARARVFRSAAPAGRTAPGRRA